MKTYVESLPGRLYFDLAIVSCTIFKKCSVVLSHSLNVQLIMFVFLLVTNSRNFNLLHACFRNVARKVRRVLNFVIATIFQLTNPAIRKFSGTLYLTRVLPPEDVRKKTKRKEVRTGNEKIFGSVEI